MIITCIVKKKGTSLTVWALERPLLQVDGPVMTLQFIRPGEGTGTIYIWAEEFLLRSGSLGASFYSCDGGLRLPLLALGQVEIQEVLGGEGGFTS